MAALQHQQASPVARRLLVIGNGMASVRLAESLLATVPRRFAITIVGAEAQPGYNRVLLSALLAQEIDPVDIVLRTADWYRDNGIVLVTGDAVTSLDVEARQARLASGRQVDFDECVFATGSEAIRLPVPGMDKPGVMTFRDLGDIDTMETAITGRRRIAVIGGGLLGIEAGHGLARRGAEVTLVHVMDRLMERQLDARAAFMLRRALERKGVRLKLSAQTVAVTGEAETTGLAFADGTSLAADLVVCAIGIRPNAALAQAAGIAVNRGIVVDDRMAASVPGFHAIGECAEHRGIAYGLVEPAYAQAATLAASLAGKAEPFTGMVPATNLKVSGVPVFSTGTFMGDDTTEAVVFEEHQRGHYRKLVFSGDRLVGCVLVGDTDDGLWYLDLIRSGADISAMRRDLIHGRAFAEQAAQEAA